MTVAESSTSGASVPAYLRGYDEVFRHSPHQAARQWFRNARFGLFLHFGLYSLLGRGEWVMYHEKIPVREYERLKNDFGADRFDAEAIAELAVQAGMKYINLTTRHHDSFSLFRTDESSFSSTESPAGRDLVGELAAACEKRGLGFFLYYSYGADWRHPYFLSNDVGVPCARPEYPVEDPTYRYAREEDFQHYLRFVDNQLRELLSNYGSVAGVWFDLISACYYRPDLFPVTEAYQLIRKLQPQALIAFKQGVTGDEDFMSQEMKFVPLEERLLNGGANEAAIRLSRKVWKTHRGKWNEVCTILQDKNWGYRAGAVHIDADEAWSRLGYAAAQRCNLLLNTGLMPDGSVHPADRETLLRVGERIRSAGFPTAGEVEPDADTGAGAV